MRTVATRLLTCTLSTPDGTLSYVHTPASSVSRQARERGRAINGNVSRSVFVPDEAHYAVLSNGAARYSDRTGCWSAFALGGVEYASPRACWNPYTGSCWKLLTASAVLSKVSNSRFTPVSSRVAAAAEGSAASLTSPFRFMASSRQRSKTWMPALSSSSSLEQSSTSQRAFRSMGSNGGETYV
jgi:hypothetical protein